MFNMQVGETHACPLQNLTGHIDNISCTRKGTLSANQVPFWCIRITQPRVPLAHAAPHCICFNQQASNRLPLRLCSMICGSSVGSQQYPTESA